MRKNEAIWFNAGKRWHIKVQIDGERKSFCSSVPGKKGKIKAEKKADKWIEDGLINENTRVEKMLDRWFEKLKLTTSYSNYHQYDKYIRKWVKPVIGAKRIGRLSKINYQEVVDNAYSAGGLSDKTLRNIRGCLMTFLRYCRDCNASKLFFDRLSIPAGAKKRSKKIISPNELKILFNSPISLNRGKLIEDFYIHAYRVEVLTGMRPGELLGLLNSNINGALVTITQSLNNEGDFTQGKNDNARRTYELSKLAIRELTEQRLMLERAGIASRYVFPSKDGGFIAQQTFRRAWQRYCESNGISRVTPYELRHTFVSVNVEMPEALKKMVIGHSLDMDTEGTYGHEKQGDMKLAAEYIDKAFTQYIR